MLWKLKLIKASYYKDIHASNWRTWQWIHSKSLKEKAKYIEEIFEYVTERDGTKVYRKRRKIPLKMRDLFVVWGVGFKSTYYLDKDSVSAVVDSIRPRIQVNEGSQEEVRLLLRLFLVLLSVCVQSVQYNYLQLMERVCESSLKNEE